MNRVGDQSPSCHRVQVAGSASLMELPSRETWLSVSPGPQLCSDTHAFLVVVRAGREASFSFSHKNEVGTWEGGHCRSAGDSAAIWSLERLGHCV